MPRIPGALHPGGPWPWRRRLRPCVRAPLREINFSASTTPLDRNPPPLPSFFSLRRGFSLRPPESRMTGPAGTIPCFLLPETGFHSILPDRRAFFPRTRREFRPFHRYEKNTGRSDSYTMTRFESPAPRGRPSIRKRDASRLAAVFPTGRKTCRFAGSK